LSYIEAHSRLPSTSSTIPAVTQDFWSFCLSRLEQELPQQQFNTWIKTLRAESGEDSAWTLIAPNRFVLQWVRERYLVLARMNGTYCRPKS